MAATDSTKKAWAMLQEALPMACDVICEGAGDAKTKRGTRLKQIFKLLHFANADVWRPQAKGARQAIPKIVAFLSATAGDGTAKERDRLKATAYLLHGAELNLWDLPTR